MLVCKSGPIDRKHKIKLLMLSLYHKAVLGTKVCKQLGSRSTGTLMCQMKSVGKSHKWFS